MRSVYHFSALVVINLSQLNIVFISMLKETMGVDTSASVGQCLSLRFSMQDMLKSVHLPSLTEFDSYRNFCHPGLVFFPVE